MQYIIGIDLGTTNIVLAYHEIGSKKAAEIFPIPQLVAPGQIEALPMLPSARYHYAEELDANQCKLPWNEGPVNSKLPNAVIGKWALDLGNKTPERLVVSAKSWLGFRAASNTEIQLPEHASEDVDTCTPLEATASYISYLKSAWEFSFSNAPLHEQYVVITVPASFDDVARALTIEAIKQAGIDSFKLIEEPQAAVYHWLDTGDKAALADTKHLMVCDVGGGTTDFTLIKIEHNPQEPEQPKLERIGVGEHLMLGGDNMDLSLAAKVLQKLEKQPTQKLLNQLLNKCQKAKEILLAESAPEEVRLQLQGRGSGLMAATQETRLTRKEVQQSILDGFLPQCAFDAKPKNRKKTLTSLSLPYPDDAAITRHIASFLNEHQALLGADDSDNRIMPDTWLLNGGPFLSAQIQKQLSDVVSQWSADDPINWLTVDAPQTAVATGAANYGRALQNNDALIKSSVVRHYFVKVDSIDGAKGICVLPKFVEQNQQVVIPGPFNLTRGEPVQFEIGFSQSDAHFEPSDEIAWNESLHQLPALTTEIGGSGTVSVAMTAELDELGVLNLNLTAQDSAEAQTNKWHLAFNLRNDNNANTNIELNSQQIAAVKEIENWYGPASNKAPKTPLRKSLEKLLGPRDQWSGQTARILFDKFLALSGKRRRSPQHERAWFNLAGFCARPGIGFAGDKTRMEQVWKLFSQGIQHSQQADLWAQWWAFWRRVSAGLSKEQQIVLYTECNQVLNKNVRKKSGKPKVTAAPDEKIRLLGSLERIPANVKADMLKSLVSQFDDKVHGSELIWCAARIVNRNLMYASPEFRLSDDELEKYDAVFEALDENQSVAHQTLVNALNPDNTDKRDNQLWGDVLPTGLSI